MCRSSIPARRPRAAPYTIINNGNEHKAPTSVRILERQLRVRVVWSVYYSVLLHYPLYATGVTFIVIRQISDL